MRTSKFACLSLAFSVSAASGLAAEATSDLQASLLPAQRQAEVRLVTLGGSVSESVCDLGSCEAIVASDDSSLYPASLAKKPRVGYYRAVSAEGILSLKPTLVIATDQAGPPTSLEQIRAAGIRVVSIPDEKTTDGAKRRIAAIAALLQAEASGKERIAQLESTLEAVRERVAKVTARPKVLFVYARGARQLQVAGSNTAATELIKLAGGEPASGGFDGYKPMTAEAVVAANPDVILMTTSGSESLGDSASLLAMPGVALTKAGRQKKIIFMDDLLLLGFGPRLGEAARELHEKLHR